MRIFFALLLACAYAGPVAALPDLVPVASVAYPYTSSEDFTPDSCAVDEGCTTAGRRRLLRFDTLTNNIGPDDLILGSPVGNPLFEFHHCHGHYHFHDYLTASLLTTTGVLIASIKQSFCLLDSTRHDSNASPARIYNCENQGLQAGWGDIYRSTLDCQYVDVTDVPPGDYVLALHVNPAQILLESDYSNNVSTTTVTISELAPLPPNDLCASATEIGIVGVPLTGSTESAGSDGAACGSSSNSKDVWFRYVPVSNGTALFSTCGSNFNTVLSIHAGCPGTVSNMLACNDDSVIEDCPSAIQNKSYLSLSVTSGAEYLVRVSGHLGQQGTYRLVVSGPAGTTGAVGWERYP